MVLTLNSWQTESHGRITTSFARCFSIIRPSDRKTFAWCDHDRPIDLATVGRFEPTPGVRIAASRVGSNAVARTTSISGPIVTDADVGLTFADIRNKLWDRCEVVEYVVDWRNPQIGPVRLYRYISETIVPSERVWEMELAGLSQFLNRKRGDVYSTRCRNVLGDSICNLNGTIFAASPQIVSGQVSSVTDATKFVIAGASLTTAAADYYALGNVRFDSAGGLYNLEGVSANVQTSAATSGAAPNITVEVTLYNALPLNPTVGQPVTLRAGCDHSRSTCQVKFANFDNFRATPDIIGSDRLFRGANAR